MVIYTYESVDDNLYRLSQITYAVCMLTLKEASRILLLNPRKYEGLFWFPDSPKDYKKKDNGQLFEMEKTSIGVNYLYGTCEEKFSIIYITW